LDGWLKHISAHSERVAALANVANGKAKACALITAAGCVVLPPTRKSGPTGVVNSTTVVDPGWVVPSAGAVEIGGPTVEIGGPTVVDAAGAADVTSKHPASRSGVINSSDTIFAIASIALEPVQKSMIAAPFGPIKSVILFCDALSVFW